MIITIDLIIIVIYRIVFYVVLNTSNKQIINIINKNEENWISYDYALLHFVCIKLV